MKKVKKILMVTALVLVGIFVAQNSHTETIDFLFWSIAMPGIVLYPLIFLLGALSGCLGCLIAAKLKNKE